MGTCIKCAMVFYILSLTMSLQAQTDKDRYIVFSGVVKDSESNKCLYNANIYIPDSEIGTVSNENGEFSLKFKKTKGTKWAIISYIGYLNTRVELDKVGSLKTFFLEPKQIKLGEVVIRTARSILEEALKKVPENYSAKENVLNGFYRETIQKNQRYIGISEVIMDVYKSSYNEYSDFDFVKILKGRKLVSQKVVDTLAIKLMGGPNISVYLDVVKNECLLFCPENLSCYNLEMEDFVTIDDRVNYVISFSPRVTLPVALFYGKVYIDKERFSFTRAEFRLDMKSKTKATKTMLRTKPFGIRFKPLEMSYVVVYKYKNGLSYLNYISNRIRFNCDWKRKLFATGFTVNSEMVVTGRREDNIKFTQKDAFNEYNTLSDRIENFADQEFWGNYNIIAPTESLEKAIDKLKKDR